MSHGLGKLTMVSNLALRVGARLEVLEVRKMFQEKREKNHVGL